MREKWHARMPSLCTRIVDKQDENDRLHVALTLGVDFGLDRKYYSSIRVRSGTVDGRKWLLCCRLRRDKVVGPHGSYVCQLICLQFKLKLVTGVLWRLGSTELEGRRKGKRYRSVIAGKRYRSVIAVISLSLSLSFSVYAMCVCVCVCARTRVCVCAVSYTHLTLPTRRTV